MAAGQRSFRVANVLLRSAHHDTTYCDAFYNEQRLGYLKSSNSHRTRDILRIHFWLFSYNCSRQKVSKVTI